MKPIEIHIEGYTIVISKDEQSEDVKDNKEITYIEYRPLDDLLKKPFTCEDKVVLTTDRRTTQG